MSSSPEFSSLAKINLDITPLFEDHWTGIPVFTRRLAQALMRHGGFDVEFTFGLSHVPKSAVLSAIRAGTGTFMRADFERSAGKQTALIDTRAHILYPSVKESFGISCHEASTIHDVSSLLMPEYHESSNVDYHMKNLARQLSTDEVVFCASQATQAALTFAYPSVASKVRILPQYVDWPESFPLIERNLSPPILGRYAAVIGTVEPRKNLRLLLRALTEPALKSAEIRFVVMGKQGWKVDQFMADLTSEERKRFLFLGYVNEFTKYRLLMHAEFLVFPSLYEGFGIPALEAMSLGKPVLASMTSCFPELIGDAGIYFDPNSSADFASAFAHMSDEQTRISLGIKAKQIASGYDCNKMAAPVLEWVNSKRKA